MRKLLGMVAVAAGLMAASGAANATPASEAGRIAPTTQTNGVETVDFRPFRHCHGPRWDRRCHGGFGIFRDRDRYRGRDRYRDRRYDDDRRGGYRDRY
jgi:hypothetical protein